MLGYIYIPFWLQYMLYSVDFYVSDLSIARMDSENFTWPLVTNSCLNLLDYTFPYLVILVSVISNAVHFAIKLNQVIMNNIQRLVVIQPCIYFN